MPENPDTYLKKSAMEEEKRLRYNNAVWERNQQRQQKRSNKLLYYLKTEYGLLTDSIILDAGCGIGVLGGYFSLSGYNVTMIDFDINYLATAKKRYPQAKLLLGDINLLPIKSSSPLFDFIFLRHVIEHLKNPQEAIDSLWKHLKKGGVLIVETPNILNPLGADSRKIWFKRLGIKCGDYIEKVFTIWQLKNLLKKYNAEIKTITNRNDIVSLFIRAISPFRVSHKIAIKKL